MLEMTRRMAEIIALHSDRDVEQVMRDIDRDRFMSPEEAKEYGLIDEIIQARDANSRLHPGVERGAEPAGRPG